jgi:uncharacterized protein (PEP-CTERM system associated)
MPVRRPAPPRRAAVAFAAGLCLAAGAARGQAGPGLRLEPSLNLGQTVTDGYQPEGASPRRGEAITTVGAGLRLTARGARLQADLDYGLSGLIHARDSQANDLQNRLQASLQGELVPRHLFVNALASIAQQPVSARELQQPDGTTSTTRNRTEVRMLSLRPTLQGRLAGVADASLALALTATDTGAAGASAQASDSVVGTATAALASTGGGRLGWNLSAARSVSDFKAGRRTEDDRVTAMLTLLADVDWLLRLRGGVESNDFRSAEKERFETWGAGLQWSPSPRTRVTLDGDRRSFGHSHSVGLEHRSRRTIWRYTDSQDVSRGSAETAQTLVGAYDLFFEMFASQEPDPALRAQLVDSLLQRNGLARDAQIAVGFLSSAVTLQRRQEASMAINGIRTSWVLSAFASRSQRLDTLSGGIDDTATGSLVRQRGLSVTVSHRLTPTGAMNLAASTVRGNDAAGLRTELRSLSAGWTERLGARTNFSLGIRHSEYDAEADAYTENAVIANLNLRF